MKKTLLTIIFLSCICLVLPSCNVDPFAHTYANTASYEFAFVDRTPLDPGDNPSNDQYDESDESEMINEFWVVKIYNYGWAGIFHYVLGQGQPDS